MGRVPPDELALVSTIGDYCVIAYGCIDTWGERATSTGVADLPLAAGSLVLVCVCIASED